MREAGDDRALGGGCRGDDRGQLDSAGSYVVGPPDKLTRLVTDSTVPPEQLEPFRRLGIGAVGWRGRRTVLAGFFLADGFLLASWAARIPAVKSAHHLSDARLGVVLFVVAAGALLSMPVTGWLAQRAGSLRAVLAAAAVFIAAVALIAVASGYGCDDVRALPGAHALRRLLGDDRFAVVTSCNERLARARLEAVGLAPPRVLVTIDSVRAGKPDPECYLLAASRLGVPPARCLVLEDAPVGLAAARSAGMATVAVTTTHAPAELDADLVVGTIADLLQARKLLLPAA
jgi:phosphoglycolate phosphatase-like HAD superfamily hydrolase